MEKQKNKISTKEILTYLAKSQRKHWLFTLIFVNLSAFWVPILYTFLGVQLKLVTVIGQSCQFTTPGLVIMLVCLGIVVIGNIATIYDGRVNGKYPELEELKADLLEQTENGVVLRDLNISANTICENKLSTLMDQVNYYISHPAKAPLVISNPRKQLDSLAKELSICLAGLLKFQDRRNVTDLFTSIIYRFPQDDDKDWHWATAERGLSIPDLIAEKDGRKSTFKYLLDHKGHSIFKNSKQSAYDTNQYIPDNEDEYDENEELKGSIACFQYEVKKNNRPIIEFVVTITSYSQQFVQDKSDGDEMVKNVKHNLEKVVMPNYIVRAKIELCLLYIKYLNESKVQFTRDYTG